MIGAQLGVHAVVLLAELDSLEGAVVDGQFLLDDVGLDGHAQVVGLAGEVSGAVIIYAVYLEGVVAGVAPEDGGHTQLVSLAEGLGDLYDLAARLFATEVDGGADGYCAHIPGFAHGAEEDLVVGVGVNVASAPQGEGISYTVASLKEAGITTDKESFLQVFAKVFDERLSELRNNGFAPIREAWLNNAKNLGQKITVNMEHESREGKFLGIDENGALLLKREGKTEKIYVGDIFYLEEK